MTAPATRSTSLATPLATCLVLGGKGFIGSHLVDALLAKGHAVRVLDRPHLAPLNDKATLAKVDWRDGDFTSESDVAAALEGCNVVFHLVSTTLPKSSNADPVFDIETNVMGTLRMLQHAVRLGVKKVVFASSGGTVYGIPRALPIDESHPTDPISSYGIGKLAIEKYLHLYRQLHGLDTTVLRLSNPYGERQRTKASQGAVAIFLGRVLRGETIDIWGDGSATRDYIYIGDVAEAMLAAMTTSSSEHLFNIGSGVGLTLNDVLDAIEKATGLKSKRNYAEARAFDVPANVLAIARANQHLDWAPRTSFADGLARTVRWLKAQPPSEI
ncbi:MAG: NAD-dependent epimerase/dehydratase family protein [Rhodospirillaceae bacterium]|nr:NAD-dependent epimerase/dehydratase family protein [Rhodospirillaceae bacterium]